MDLGKTFDQVPWNELWNILQKYKFETNLIAATQCLCKNQLNYVRTNNMKSEKFYTRTGI